MQISGVSINSYTVPNTSLSSSPKQTLDNNTFVDKDEVTLSPEAMKEFEKLAMYTEQAGAYLPKVTVLNNADSHKIGYGAWAESFQDTYKGELSEYNSKFKDYYQETKNEHGILSADDHYEKVISLKDGNVEFQKDFEEKLKSDPRMLELMGILGIKKPT